jgi:hypothetical protein
MRGRPLEDSIVMRRASTAGQYAKSRFTATLILHHTDIGRNEDCAHT